MWPAAAWLVAVAVASPAPQGDGQVNPAPPTEHRPASKVEVDHKYYTLSVYQNNAGGTFDDNFIQMESAELKRGLSDTMVGAEMIQPLFPFPFYGHELDSFYITTHGFLSLSPRLHDYIYKTQYIAPLRIKLDPSRSNSSTISLLSLPDRLTVEWSNVSVMANAEHPSGGSFTFQLTLRPNGDIVFVYIEVQPVLTTAALYDHEPVAGISDAFLLHGSELHLYNKINIDNIDINTRTVAVFKALPTCVGQSTCSSCAALSTSSNFSCYWCEAAGHCSDGADRRREDWDTAECHLTNTTGCEAPRSGGHTEWRTSTLGGGLGEEVDSSTIVSIAISSVAVLLLLGMGIVFLYLYALYNENTIVGRHLKRLQQSYDQFGGAAQAKMTSLELGKKKSQAKAAKAAKPVSEFVNPHPMVTNNNVITASM